MKFVNLLFVSFLMSCSGTGNNSEQFKSEQDTIQKEVEDHTSFDLNEDADIPEGWIQVEMNPVTFLFEKMDMSWDITGDANEQKCSFKDTAFFELWPGDWMNDKVIKVKGDAFEITELFVQEVLVIGVDSERAIEMPFCVLQNWKKSTSNWIPLEPVNGEFRFEIHDNFDTETINIELTEFKKEIKNSCGNEWFEEFEDAHSLNEIPFSEFTIQYNFKVISRELESGNSVENFVVFFTPSSC